MHFRRGSPRTRNGYNSQANEANTSKHQLHEPDTSDHPLIHPTSSRLTFLKTSHEVDCANAELALNETDMMATMEDIFASKVSKLTTKYKPFDLNVSAWDKEPDSE